MAEPAHQCRHSGIGFSSSEWPWPGLPNGLALIPFRCRYPNFCRQEFECDVPPNFANTVAGALQTCLKAVLCWLFCNSIKIVLTHCGWVGIVRPLCSDEVAARLAG